MYGVDISLRRADDLDKRILRYIEQNNTSLSVLELGCGAGGQSVRMVNAGVSVTAIDVQPFQSVYQKLRQENNLSSSNLNFIQGDIREVERLILGQQFDLCLLQRTLHYLNYQEAKILLEKITKIISGRLYLSVTGLNSDIGRYYKDKEKVVSERFCFLIPIEQETFSITKPLCLYTEKELIELLSAVGWKVEEVWVSTFGNIKAICVLGK